MPAVRAECDGRDTAFVPVEHAPFGRIAHRPSSDRSSFRNGQKHATVGAEFDACAGFKVHAAINTEFDARAGFGNRPRCDRALRRERPQRELTAGDGKVVGRRRERHGEHVADARIPLILRG